MDIDFTKVIKRSVEPRLNYHGFKFNKEKSDTAAGQHEFSRTYWGKSQSVLFCRVLYDLSDIGELTSESDDIPTELGQDSGSITHSGRWLSNRYITAAIVHECSAIEITPKGLADYAEFKHLKDVPFDQALPIIRQLRRDTIWWKVSSASTLRQSLKEMIRIILTQGLEWLDEQVAEVRRHHEKLDRRRKREILRINRRH
jgi:hypothetical protein